MKSRGGEQSRLFGNCERNYCCHTAGWPQPGNPDVWLMTWVSNLLARNRALSFHFYFQLHTREVSSFLIYPHKVTKQQPKSLLTVSEIHVCCFVSAGWSIDEVINQSIYRLRGARKTRKEKQHHASVSPFYTQKTKLLPPLLLPRYQLPVRNTAIQQIRKHWRLLIPDKNNKQLQMVSHAPSPFQKAHTS